MLLLRRTQLYVPLTFDTLYCLSAGSILTLLALNNYRTESVVDIPQRCR